MRILMIFIWLVTLLRVNIQAQDGVITINADDPPALSEPSRELATAPVSPNSLGGMSPGSMGMGNAGPGGGGGGPGYTFTWIPSQAIAGHQTNLQVVQQNLSFGFPVYRSDNQMVLLTTRVQNTSNQTDAFLPQSLRPMPEQLWNISMGAMYLRKLESGSNLGMMATLGSASDRPFHELRDYAPMFMAFYRLPVRERDAWMFSVFYSPVSELVFPVPGVSYLYQPSDDFRMNIGIPFSLMYQPCDDLTLELNYMVLRTVSAQSTLKLTDTWSTYLRYAWANQSWFLSDREEDRERLFSYDMRLMAGIRYALTERLQFDLGAGYVFDRFYFTSTKSSDMEHDRLAISSGPIAALSLLVRF